MFVFERRFHRGVLTLLIIQVVLSFFTVYLLERMAHDETRVPIPVDLGLRRSLNTLVMSLQHPNPDFAVWNLTWSQALTETGQLLQKARHPIQPFVPLAKLDSRSLHQDANLRAETEKTVIALSQSYEAHWSQTQKSFRLTAVGGAWSVTLLSLIAFVSLAYIHSQIKRFLLLPLREICQTLLEWKQGNRLRRCSVLGMDPNVQRSMDIINKVLDEHRPLKVMAPIEHGHDGDER